MDCYHVHVPADAKVAGVTADGQLTSVLPGEYVVHLLQPKFPAGEPLVRFVAADPVCRDVHIPLEVATWYLADSANDGAAKVA